MPKSSKMFAQSNPPAPPSEPESPRNYKNKAFGSEHVDSICILPDASFQAARNYMVWWNILYWTQIVLRDGKAYYSPIIDGKMLVHIYGNAFYLYDELYAIYDMGEYYVYIPIKLASPGEMLHPIHTIGEML